MSHRTIVSVASVILGSLVSRLSQPMPFPIDDVSQLATLASVMAASIALAFTVIQPCAAG